MNATKFLTAIVMLPMLASCSKEQEPQSAKPAEPAPVAPTALPSQSAPGQGAGTITGRVVFKGTHTPGKVPIGKDKEVCGDTKLDPTLSVGNQGEVKNAVIQISDLVQGKAPAKETVLDQAKCEYAPHVLVIPTGATVKIKNSDGILHNVHTRSEKNPPFNRAQPKFMKEISEKFTKPEIIPVRCDVHGWMSGWIVVTDNPFYEVTPADGRFKFDSVPVGKYTLEVWHETLGKATQQVEIKTNEVTNVTFEFQMKK
jgi:plastocyanin